MSRNAFAEMKEDRDHVSSELEYRWLGVRMLSGRGSEGFKNAATQREVLNQIGFNQERVRHWEIKIMSECRV